MASSTTGSLAALFRTEDQATAAIEALQAAGFQAHQIGAARSAHHASTATETGVNNETTSTGVIGTTGMGARGESILDKVKGFFEGNDASQGTVGSVAEYANESGLPNAAGYDAHSVTGGDYPFRKDDVSALLGSLAVSSERAHYLQHSLSTQPGSVLVTLSAGERQGEAERMLTEHGGDLGGSSAS